MAQGADRGTKRLISMEPEAWVRWITGLDDVTVGPVLTGEFQWIARATDALIRAYSPGQGEFITISEINLRPRVRNGRRLKAYAGLAEEKYDLPVYPVMVNVLQPSEGTVIPDQYESVCLGKRSLQEYRVLNLWEIDVNIVFDTPLPALLPFVPVFRGGADEAVVRRALVQLRQEPTLSDLEPLLALFAAYVLHSDIVKEIVRWDMTVLRENPIAEELIQMGLQEGRQEGLVDGEVRGLREALLDAIEVRFGTVPEELRQRVLWLQDVSTLRALHRRALTSSLAELRDDFSK